MAGKIAMCYRLLPTTNVCSYGKEIPARELNHPVNVLLSQTSNAKGMQGTKRLGQGERS